MNEYCTSETESVSALIKELSTIFQYPHLGSEWICGTLRD